MRIEIKNILQKNPSEEYEEENENVELLNEYDETENELSSAIDYFNNISKREKEKEKLLNKTYKNSITEKNRH